MVNYYSPRTQTTYRYNQKVFVNNDEWYIASDYRQVQSSPLIDFVMQPSILVEYSDIEPDLTDQIVLAQSVLDGQLSMLQQLLNTEITERQAGDVITTDNVPEGSNNLYHTVERVEAIANALLAAVVDSSPETLDTLNEIAQALGEDPNFATTITNLISLKASQVDLTVVEDEADQHEEIQQIRNSFIQSYSMNYKEISKTDGITTNIDI